MGVALCFYMAGGRRSRHVCICGVDSTRDQLGNKHVIRVR